jgi:hypothetical protein
MEIEVIKELVSFDNNQGYGIRKNEEEKKKATYEIKISKKTFSLMIQRGIEKGESKSPNF